MEEVSEIKLDTSGVATTPLINNKKEVAKLEIEQVKDFNSLTKEELVSLVTNLTDQVKTLSTKLEEVPKEKDEMVKEINEHYESVLKRQHSIINRLVKRLNLIKGIIDLDKEEE